MYKSRRSHGHTRIHIKFSWGSCSSTQSPWTSSPRKRPHSPRDIFTDFTDRVKRFFSPSSKHENGSQPKRARVHKMNVTTEPFVSSHIRKRDQENRSSDDSYVAPDRTKRYGMILEDITFFQNIPRSNTLPNRKSRILDIADVEFTPLPQTQFVVPQDNEFHFSTCNSGLSFTTGPIHLSPVAEIVIQPPPPTPQVVEFITLEQFTAMQETTNESLSSLPVHPGILQDALFQHVMTALVQVIKNASEGIKNVWGTREIVLPKHFTEAIQFIASSSRILATTLTTNPVPAINIPSIRTLYLDTVKLVVEIAKVIDGMDFLSLIKDSTRLEIGKTLQTTLETLISEATTLPDNAESTLELIAGGLHSTIPTLLLPSRFRVYQVYIEYLFTHARHRLIQESVVSAFLLKKIDRLIPIVKHVGKQLDRLAEEETMDIEKYRRKLILFDGHYDMFKNFFNGTRGKSSRVVYEAFLKASDIAKLSKETEIEAECQYRIAKELISTGSFDNLDPRIFIVYARTLNSSDSLGEKLDYLVDTLRLSEIKMLNDLATTVFLNSDEFEFEVAMRRFAGELLLKYPVQGQSVDKVLVDDVTRGMLKLVRIYHPDKNAARDEEWKWICEEITKILNQMIERYRELQR